MMSFSSSEGESEKRNSSVFLFTFLEAEVDFLGFDLVVDSGIFLGFSSEILDSSLFAFEELRPLLDFEADSDFDSSFSTYDFFLLSLTSDLLDRGFSVSLPLPSSFSSLPLPFPTDFEDFDMVPSSFAPGTYLAF